MPKCRTFPIIKYINYGKIFPRSPVFPLPPLSLPLPLYINYIFFFLTIRAIDDCDALRVHRLEERV